MAACSAGSFRAERRAYVAQPPTRLSNKCQFFCWWDESSESAGHVQRVTGNVGGVIAGQEERGGGHFVHRAEATEWRHPARASLDGGIEALQMRSSALSVNRSRRNGIDRDVVLG